MKKLTFLSAIFGLAFIGAAGAADITVYYSPTCPHCHHAREFIGSNLIYEYPNLTVSEVNVMTEAAMPVFQEALTKCKYDNGGVPVIVVGEKCFQGYADFMQQELRDAVEADMSDKDKQIAAENKKELAADPDGFKAKHSDRVKAISEYDPAAPKDVQKKSDGASSMYFYILLIVLVAALGFVLVRKDNKK